MHKEYDYMKIIMQMMLINDYLNVLMKKIMNDGKWLWNNWMLMWMCLWNKWKMV
jgi:hypothetical protein